MINVSGHLEKTIQVRLDCVFIEFCVEEKVIFFFKKEHIIIIKGPTVFVLKNEIILQNWDKSKSFNL